MELLKVENLTKKFKKKGILFQAVSQVSFTLEKGECLGIVGESGCGKRRTANMFARLLKEDVGEFFFEDRKISGGMLLKPVGKGLQMIFQNPQDSFDPRDSVIEGIMQGAAAYGIYSRKELTEKALELFSYVGLKEEYQNRKIRQLSGGECQRAAIARALICEPKLLICDEATSALDVLVQAQIIDLLKRLKEEKGMSMLFITHDLPLAAAFCDRVAVMHQGRIIEIGASREVLKNPRQEETQKLLQAVLTI